MKKTFTLRSIFAAIVLCFGLTANAQGPTVVTHLAQLGNFIGQEVQVDNLTIDGEGYFAKDGMHYIYDDYAGYAILKVTASIVGKPIPAYPLTFSVIGTVVEPELGMSVIECTALIAPPSVTVAGLPTQIPDVAYLGETVSFSNIVIYGDNLTAETIELSLSSETDLTAEYALSANSLSTSDVQTADGASINFSITPKTVSTEKILVDGERILAHNYVLSVKMDGKMISTTDIAFLVKAAAPEFTTSVNSGMEGTIYKGEEYEISFNLKGNKYVTGNVTLASAPGSGFVFEKSVYTAAEVTGPYGAEVIATITPELVSEDKWTKVPFSIVVSTDGAADSTYLILERVVLDNAPLLNFGTGTLSDVYVGAQASTKISVKGNPYVTEDVTFEAISPEVDRIEPATLTAAQIAAGADITVYVTPTATSEERVEFKFKAKSATQIDTTYFVYADEILAAEATIDVEVPWYIANDAIVGMEFTQTFEITASPFITQGVTITSSSADVTSITPSTIALEDLKGKTVTVTVVFTPKTASEIDKYGSVAPQQFELQVNSADYENPIPVVFSFGVVPAPEIYAIAPFGDNVVEGVVKATAGEEATIEVNVKGSGFNSSLKASVAATGAGDVTTCEVLNSPWLSAWDINQPAGFSFQIAFEAAAAGDYTCTLTCTSSELKEPHIVNIPIKVEEAPSLPSALENVQVEVKATKVIENGQLFILKDGVKYNVLGTVVE